MTFIALGIEKSCLTQQKTALEYEEMTIANELNDIEDEIAEYDDIDSDDMTSSEKKILAELEDEQETYDAKKDSIETQLKTINAEIESYEKAVDTNIKSECKLSISV